MKEIFIDIETYSELDLSRVGMYKYSSHPSFSVLLFAYSVDGGEVNVVDFASGETLPPEIRVALDDVNVTKWAYNCSFERVTLGAWFKCTFKPESWKCTMIWAATLGLPLSLADVGAILNLDQQKMKEGKELIRYFCMPCKATKTNGGRTRNLPSHAPEKWAVFKQYNKVDVQTEIAIHKRLEKYPVPEQVWDEYHISEEINDRGILIDRPFVDKAIMIDAVARENNIKKLVAITGIDNPNSVVQLLAWLRGKGVDAESLGKKDVEQMVKTATGEVLEVLQLRQQISKTSTKKYTAMLNAACPDNRCRGMFQFYGSRTGRFAGRLVQLQNLPQNKMTTLDDARELVRNSNVEALEMLYDSIPNVLSELIRTAFVPAPGKKFIVADYSAIEARVLSHLAGEKWRNEVFAKNGDIYCASASAMFGVPVEKHGLNSHLRQKGKISELAFGYNGGVGALISMGAIEMGLSEEELPELVRSWRAANPRIVKFWYDIDKAAKQVIRTKRTITLGCLQFSYRGGIMFIRLPSGRSLAYVKPAMGINRFGGESITFEGLGLTRKWERLETFGGKLTENIVQAISRDILCNAMAALKDYEICGHVHDECICQVDVDVKVETICEIMGRTPEWIPGLKLRAEGYECEFYKKD